MWAYLRNEGFGNGMFMEWEIVCLQFQELFKNIRFR